MRIRNKKENGRDGLMLHPPSGMPFKHRAGHDSVAVLLSGGVDSAVAAMLLRDRGFDVVGVTMKIPSARADGKSACCGMSAAAVAAELGIAHHFMHVSEAFFRCVIFPFQSEYLRGNTPNPCIACNSELKFHLVWDYLADRFDIANLATGHYARVVHTSSGTHLCRAVNHSKDQSYFLYGLTSRKLDNLYLPLGEETKESVRKLAGKAGLSISQKSESMDLCFAMEDDYRSALPENMGDASGIFINRHGKKLGNHDGIWNYTVGQRKGIGISSSEPLYVLSIDPETNVIVAGSHDEAMADETAAADLNILLPDILVPGARLFGKIRSPGNPAPCTVVQMDAGSIRVRFDRPVFAPAPGQHLVLYTEEDCVVCGGRITAGNPV